MQRETCVFVVTDPITGSINSPHNMGVNPHYGGILGKNYIPEHPINSLESYEEKRGLFGDIRLRLLKLKSFFLFNQKGSEREREIKRTLNTQCVKTEFFSDYFSESTQKQISKRS